MMCNSFLSSVAAVGAAASLLESIKVFDQEGASTLRSWALTLVTIQGVTCLMMFLFLSNEVVRKPHKDGKFANWKYLTILVSEVLDILFEIGIVVSTKYLLDGYNEDRRRTIAQMAESADEYPEPADLTLSYICLLAFASISVVFDFYESWQTVETLGEFKYVENEDSDDHYNNYY